jgi:DNA-binding transcriptional LysR family regulator
MKHSLPPLESLKVFESAARNLSFSQAADELCITKSAVSYQIKKLETQLALSLFKRNIRQVLLTDAGQQLFQSTQRVFSDLKQSIGQLSPSDGAISIAVTTYVASRWLSPLVTDFCISNPDISLKFQHSVNSRRFNLEDVDLAIRWGHCGLENNRTRLFEIPMPMFPVCSPRLMDEITHQGRWLNFSNATLLCEEREQDLWQEWAEEEYQLNSNPRRVIDDANVRVQAAIDGQGIVLADAMMQSEINSGNLVILSGQELTGYGYVLSQSKAGLKKKAVQELKRWLVREQK